MSACLILHQPQIAPNTGNIIRLSANCGFPLHLIDPLGFSLTEKAVRRAGMDYSELVSVQRHSSLQQCLHTMPTARLVIVSTRCAVPYHRFAFQKDDALLFGNETSGLPREIWQQYADACCITIPMKPGNRSLNLSNAVAIVAWSCWQATGFA